MVPQTSGTMRRSKRLLEARCDEPIKQPSRSTPKQEHSKRKRLEEDIIPPKRSVKRQRQNERPSQSESDQLRVRHWTEHGTWPVQAESEMDRFRDLMQNALARKRSKSSIGRKRSDASLSSYTTQAPSDQQQREQKSAPYRHPRYEGQLRERGSYMNDHPEGIALSGKELLVRCLKTPRQPPEHTLFSRDLIFEKTCQSLKGENETKVIRRIAELVVPSAEVLAIQGAAHLEILRETINAGWNNAFPFCGPRPQPDYGLGFKREAFSVDQLEKLKPLIGNEIEDCSHIAATYNMYLPFLTCEVKCGAAALDVADRQNCNSQSVALRNKVILFRLAGRLHEMHRQVNGFSVSHSDQDVRIWAHYVFVQDDDCTFHRYSVANFSITPTLEGDQRWKAWTFFMNVLDLWVADHFQKLCSVIDTLPNTSAVGTGSQELSPSLANASVVLESPRIAQVLTPDTTLDTFSSLKRHKTG